MRFICKTSLMVCIFLPLLLSAQKENANWYFGRNAAVNFSNGTVKSLDSCAMNAFEGCATISDTAGKLLFYTDGIRVYNKKHVMMQNGDALKGNPSSTQSAMIVRKPGSYDLYYIITVNGISGNPQWGSFYSVVDMREDNGNGKLMQKNISLQSTTDEKITAVRHSNGTDIWVIIPERNTSKINSYLITDTGINLQPVRSTTIYSTSGSIGYLRVSLNCKKLAMCIYNGSNVNEITVADYNNSDGKVSNAYSLYMNKPYGMEFSPNGRYLYVSAESNDNNLCQFDLEAGTAADVQSSVYAVCDRTNTNFYIGGMHLGLDNAIYFSQVGTSYLGKIRYPNNAKAGTSVMVNALYLKKGYASYGIQNVLFSLPGKPEILFSNHIANCQSRIKLSITNYSSVESINWDFGDSLSMPADNQSDSLQPFHNYSYATNYKVSAIVKYKTGKKDTLKQWIKVKPFLKNPFIPLFPDSVSKCKGDNYTFNCTNKYYTYLWENGDTTRIRVVQNPGIYILQYTDSMGCINVQTIKMKDYSGSIDLGPDTAICLYDSILLGDRIFTLHKKYEWSTGSTQQYIYAKHNSSYFLKVTDKNGCKLYDTVFIAAKPLAKLDLGDDIAICNGDSVFIPINGNADTYTYWWNGNTIAGNQFFKQAGQFVVSASLNACIIMDTVQLLVNEYPLVDLGDDDSICISGAFPLDAGPAQFYQWNTGEKDRVLKIYNTGKYSVIAANGNCSSSDSITIALKEIELFLPTAFTPNDDAVNDVYEVNKDITCIEFAIYNTWGEQLFFSNDANPHWDGTYKNEICQTGYYVFRVVYWDCLHRRVYKSQGIYLLR